MNNMERNIIDLVRNLRRYEPFPYSDRIRDLYSAINYLDRITAFRSNSNVWFRG